MDNVHVESLSEEESRTNTNMPDTSDASYGFKKGEWDFNDEVVDNFENEMKGHIPSHSHVIKLSADIVERIHDKSARILSFWAGKGIQFKPYLERGWDPKNFFGMNYSKPLDRCFRERYPHSQSRQVDIENRPYNPHDRWPL